MIEPSAAYFMLACHSPEEGDHAQYSYEPDDEERSWIIGQPFDAPPPVPVPVTVEPGEEGLQPELTDVPVPLMSRRLAECLTAAGVSNIDFYPARVTEQASGRSHDGLLAFNLIGLVAAADLSRSTFSAPDGPLLSVDFDGLAIDPAKAGAADMFRLAESVNGIVVSRRVRQAILDAGITTLEFILPEDWVG